MDKNRKSILDLNKDCKAEIIKYIIAGCELDGKNESNGMYSDLVYFALAHKDFEAVLQEYYNDLYDDLEFLFLENRDEIEIDFEKLQSIYPQKIADAFWDYFASAIRLNSKVEKVSLFYRPQLFELEFLYNFQMIKRALENKRSLITVQICLNGYTLDDLNNFGHIKELILDVRMSAEALVSVCESNPELYKLKFMSTEIQGRLSDIVPHCRNLRVLKFMAKPHVDMAEYAPLARLPNLEEMTIHGAFKNGSMLNMFEALQKCQRSATNNLIISFCDQLPHLSTVTVVRHNSFQTLELLTRNQTLELLTRNLEVKIKTSYKLKEISKDTSPLEQSVATITLINADLKIELTTLNIYECSPLHNDIRELSSLLRQFNVEKLICKGLFKPLKLRVDKTFASLSDELTALKSIFIYDRKLHKLDTLALVKVKSITFLKCSFLDWESIELLSALTCLEAVDIEIDKEFDNSILKALYNLLNTCQVSSSIQCMDVKLHLRAYSKTKTLTIWDARKSGSLDELLEAFANRDLITIEELHINFRYIDFEDILKVAKVQTIKKLYISLKDTNGIEKLSELTKLEELAISLTKKGSLIKLFDQLAIRESPSLQCLRLRISHLSPEEILKASRIRSLRKLELSRPSTRDCVSLTELANSNIEELSVLLNEGRDWTMHSKPFLPSIFLFKLQSIRSRNRYIPIVYDWPSLECADYRLRKEVSGSERTNISVYQAFARKSVKLTHLTAVALCVEDLNEITRIKSLKELNLMVAIDNLPDLDLGELSELESLHIEFDFKRVRVYKIDTVLAILKCCRNLDRFSTAFKHEHDLFNKTIMDIQGLLKSVRDPALQGPLTFSIKHLCYFNSDNKPDILEVLYEDAFLKVIEHSYSELE